MIYIGRLMKSLAIQTEQEKIVTSKRPLFMDTMICIALFFIQPSQSSMVF